TKKSLLILQFNANGLKNHINELQNVSHHKRIDIALITETHCTKHPNFHIPGYILLKVNHPDNTARGGVAIFIKSSIYFQPLPNYCHDHVHSCMILIKLNSTPITIGAFYSPPRHNITNIIFTDFFKIIKNNFIIGGDFNSKHHAWGCRANNPRGIVLQNFININSFNILSPPNTIYWPSSIRKKPDILDIFVAKKLSNLHCSVNNILGLNSDHSSVLLNISASKCSNCKKLPGIQDERLCMVCSLLEEDNIRAENNAQEKWNRKNKKQRKNNFYLTPNPHLKYLSLTKSNSKKTLPVLKNGSRFEELKGCRTNTFAGRVVFNITCAFDSLASLIMVSFCDSQKYSEMLDIFEKSDFINFICKIVNSEITSTSYSHRADLIIKSLTVEIKEMEYTTILVVCASTIGHVIDSLMEKYPSAKEISNCPVCKNINERKIMHFTFQINDDDNISKLQNFFDERLEKYFLICGHSLLPSITIVLISLLNAKIIDDFPCVSVTLS
ncbi:hypothetical protein AGLY_014024, partial [Aphis glycines]